MTTAALTGSAGLQQFNERFAQASQYTRIMNGVQKRRLAALRKRADQHDLLGDWQPLIE